MAFGWLEEARDEGVSEGFFYWVIDGVDLEGCGCDGLQELPLLLE